MKNIDKLVYIPPNITPYPLEHEISAAKILAKYFHSKVSFIERTQLRTADFMINGQFWEHKSPIGSSKRTIQNNLRKADNQAQNIIIDLRRCEMDFLQAKNRIYYELARAHKIKRLLIIQKNEKVVEIK